MSTVALAGDWHVNTRWVRARIADVATNGVALILDLGDFGIWPGPSGRAYIDRLEKTCVEHAVGIWVTPGNHEDWGSLTRLWSRPEHSGRPLHVSEHIAILPRGYRFTLEGRSFVSLGGAPSVDLEYRSRNHDWWAEEAITPEDVATVVEGRYADVMLAHDAPLAPYEVPQVARIRNERGWPDHALAYARVGAELMHEAFLGVRPRLFAHGHYHVIDETRRQSSCPARRTRPVSGRSTVTASTATSATSTWRRWTTPPANASQRDSQRFVQAVSAPFVSGTTALWCQNHG